MTNTEELIHVRKTVVRNLRKDSSDEYIWDVHRENADHVASILARPPEVWIRKQARRIDSCAGWLIFKINAYVEGGTLLLKLRNAPFCHVRFCPICQWRRSLRWKAKMYRILPRIEAKHPTARWLFLTLTTRNVSILDLREHLDAMNMAWGRLVKRRAFRHVAGWIRSVEVTRNEHDRTAHPHFHCLLLMKSTYFKGGPDYLTTQKWSELWGDVLRMGYSPVVDIRQIKDKQGTGINRAIAETLKYAVKEFDMVNDPEWFTELVRQTLKTRAVASGGELKRLLDNLGSGTMTHLDMEADDVEEMRLRFHWATASSRYQRRITSPASQKNLQ
jgi:plasmid rolling circle replication initiator protein Rep